MTQKVKPNYIKTFILSSLAFGLPLWFLFMYLNFLNAGVPALLSGVLFGLVITAIVRLLIGRSDTEQKDMLGEEIVLLSGGANHLQPREAVGGWLYLTRDALHFKSHGFNVQVHQTVIPLREVKSIETFNMLGIVPNGLRIVTSNGKESFVVNKRKRWIREISALMNT
ncbi:MAG: GRAM domain-containing protein [Candidatus Saccharimonadales bacterium]